MFRSRRMAPWVAFATVVIMVNVFLTSAPAGDKEGNSNPVIIPPHAKPYGLSYGEWEAKWWQALLEIPGPSNPFFVGGVFGDERDVKFLTGVPGGQTINITISSETALFFPLINSECSSLEAPPFHGATEDDQRACANGFMDNVSGVFAVIDGHRVRNIAHYRTQSPQFTFDVPADNALGVPGPATGTSVDAGYYLFLASLRAGTHTLHFGGTFGGGGGSIETTYIITVKPEQCHGADEDE